MSPPAGIARDDEPPRKLVTDGLERAVRDLCEEGTDLGRILRTIAQRVAELRALNIGAGRVALDVAVKALDWRLLLKQPSALEYAVEVAARAIALALEVTS